MIQQSIYLLVIKVATKMNSIPAPTPLLFTDDVSSMLPRWITWRDNLERYFCAAQIKEDDQKHATLLYCGGEDLARIHKTLEHLLVLEVIDTSVSPATRTPIPQYDASITVLDNYFTPKSNATFERHKFRTAHQNVGENTLAYITRLRELANTCGFNDYTTDQAIVDQYLEKCTSHELRKKLLATTDLTLGKLISLSQTWEITQRQAADMEGSRSAQTSETTDEELNYTQSKQTQKSTKPNPKNTVCYGCGSNNHIYNSTNCPAKGKSCRFCEIQGHFESVCNKKKRQMNGNKTYQRQTIPNRDNSRHAYQSYYTNPPRETDHTQDFNSDNSTHTRDSDDFLFHVFSTNNQSNKHKRAQVWLDNEQIDFIIDSGASCDIIDYSTFQRYFEGKVKVFNTDVKIYTYGSTSPLHLHGVFYPCLTVNNRKIIGPVIIAKANTAGCLLSEKSSSTLGLLQIGESINLINKTNDVPDCIKQYADTFKGLGKLNDLKLHLEIDKSITPCAQAVRRVPFHQRKIVKDEISRLIKLDVIEPVTGPTSWCSPIQIVTKSDGAARLCVDLRKANTAVKRIRYPIPTLDEILDKVNGATVFSKVDLKMAYHQIELDDESRDITTFTSSEGIYRYKRLVFGISSAFEEFQRIISGCFKSQKGIVNISDDILIFGRTPEEHDAALATCFKILSEKGLTVNREKCKFHQSEIEFFGFILSANGIRPMQSKIKAVENFPNPKNPKEVRSFLGLINYLGRFIPNLSSLSLPLRNLTKQNVVWQWTIVEQQSFNELKRLVSTAPVMAHFDTQKETKVVVDASPIGLGAILLQASEDNKFRAVAYASRALTPTETRYSQTEREALSVVWACEKFHLFLVGKHFIIETDHKPLLGIYSTNGKPSTRVSRWSLRLQPYSFTLRYITGESNPADILSRHPLQDGVCRKSVHEIEAEQTVNFHIAHSIPKALTLSEVLVESQKDKVLCDVQDALRSGQWHIHDHLKPFKLVKDELSCKSGIIMKGTQMVIPNALRKRVLSIAHESHMGISKTKELLRSKVWWPDINKEVETLIKSCTLCLSTQPVQKGEPLKMTVMPKLWDTIHADICGPFPDGWSMLGTVDECSRWPNVFLIRDTTTSGVIKKLLELFTVNGTPNTLVTDNGPQFTSKMFKDFCLEWGIKHRKVTPLHPEANSEIERLFRTVLKVIRIAVNAGKDWKTELRKFLLAYRNSPHASTKISPAKMMFGRNLQDKLPSTPKSNSSIVNQAKRNDTKAKERMKNNADSGRKPSDIKVGDTVLLSQRKKNKFSTPFSITPYTVVHRKGSAIDIQDNKGRQYRRNVAAVRRIPRSSTPPTIQEEESEPFDSYPDNVPPHAIQMTPHETTGNAIPNIPMRPISSPTSPRHQEIGFGFPYHINDHEDTTFVRRTLRRGAGKPPERLGVNTPST